MSKDSIDRGIEIMKKMFGEEMVAKQANVSPRLAQWRDWTQGVVFGEVWTRPQLDLKTRSLVTLAALTALYRPEQLRTHVKGAINNGASEEEVLEVIMHVAFYAGWPGSVKALEVAEATFKEMRQSSST